MGLVRILSQMADIEGIVVSDVQGEVDFHSGDVTPDTVASVAAVTVHEMNAIGELFGAGKFHSLIVQGEKTTIVAQKGDKIASTFIKERMDAKALLRTLGQTPWKASKATSNTKDKNTTKSPLRLSTASKISATSTASPNTSSFRRISPPPPPLKKNKVDNTTASSSITATHSIPPTPEAHTLKNLRLALYFGDISGAKVLQVELARFEYPGKRDAKETAQFEEVLSDLMTTVTSLLAGDFSAPNVLEEITERSESIDKSVYWAASIWLTRMLSSLGELEAARKAALAAYQVAHDFDSDTRTANRCTIANTYVMSGNADKALKLLKSGTNTTMRCQIQAITGMAYLIEAQALAMKNLHLQSKTAAKKAEEILPRSPYPKLMLARLSMQKKDFNKATSLYSEILTLNPKQPDALADLNILSRIESGKLLLNHVISYFALRETAPTEKNLSELKRLFQELPGFEQLRSLVAWRLLGLDKAEEAAKLYTPGDTAARTHRFKPGIVIGFGPSSIIAAGYHGVASQLKRRLTPSDSDSETRDEDRPISLSIPPEELQELMENNSHDNLFSGELKVFSMPDLLEFLRNGHRTGSLICSSKQGVGAVELQDGYITSAIVPNADNIGTLLLKKGKIKKDDIERAIDSQHKDLAGTRLGAVLVEKGLVDAETIKEVIVEQTFSAIKTMLKWDDGRFAFTPAFDNAFDREFVEVKLDSQHVLMELYRQIDEQNR